MISKCHSRDYIKSDIFSLPETTAGTARHLRVETEREVRWAGRAIDELKSLPEEVRRFFGYALSEVQFGRKPSEAKQMKGNLREVMEIRVNDEAGAYRTMYTLKLKGVVYVLGAFQKKSKSGIATPQRDLERLAERLKLAKKEYRESWRE